MTTAYIDFETTSKTDLKTHGLTRYVQCPTTEVLCLGWALDDGPVECWFPEDGPIPHELLLHVRSGFPIVAHNAAFDRMVWEYILSNDYDVPSPKLEQWRCSSARAMAHGLPGGLADICRAVDLPIQKQEEGKRLINQYSLQGRVPYAEGDKSLMAEYCMMDVRTMRMFCTLLRELSTVEWSEYHLNEKINEFGIPVDVEFATAALNYAGDVKAEVDGEILKLTQGEVKSARARKARDEWVLPLLTKDQKKLLLVVVDGVEKYSFDQEHRDNLLAADDLHPDAEKLISLINDAGGSSTSKYSSMVNNHVDGRVHNALVWHGAATGRWTSKGIQVHNMPRNAFENPEGLIEYVVEDYMIDKPAKTLSRLLRASITHPTGVTFGDWSAIEGRICPWLSGDSRAEATLDVFRRDEDIYIATATSMGMDDRQAGKVAALSMQFAGGAGALQRMAKNYGVIYTYDEADELKDLWRDANEWCVDFWKGLLSAATSAFKTPCVEYTCGRATFLYDGADWLWMKRPSGNYHAYFQPKIELVTYPWGDEGYELTALAGSVRPKAGAPWPRRTLTGGVLIENLTQGAAADLMRHTVLMAQHLPVLFSVHDELVIEGDHQAEVKTIMETLPEWAEGLPIKAEVKWSQRYGK